MEIALIAAETKKELMVQFCIAYCGVLAKHNICATKMTGKMVSEATGLDIEQLLPGNQGGIQQIASRVAYNEIDVLLYFRDGSDNPEEIMTDADLMRECDRSKYRRHDLVCNHGQERRPRDRALAECRGV